MHMILSILLLVASSPPVFEAQTLDGRTLSGSLVELTPERFAIDAAEGRVSIGVENLLSLSAKQKPAQPRKTPDVSVELADGSLVAACQFATKDARARITLSDGEPIDASLSAVRSVRLQRASGSLLAEWNRLARLDSDADLLAVRKGEAIDYLRGTIHEVTDAAVRFGLDAETLPVKRARVFGLVYRHAAASKLPPTVCQITDAAGSRWAASSIKLAEKLEWTTPTGLRIAEPTERIVAMDFSGGKIVYLSDLEPEHSEWTPYFASGKPPATLAHFYAPRGDRNFAGEPLRLGGVVHAKGLALHARSEVVYRTPQGFGRFAATVGIDDSVRPAGKVRLVVRGDDAVLFDAVLSGRDAPRNVDLDLKGVRRLAILAEFADKLGPGNDIVLGNARFTR